MIGRSPDFASYYESAHPRVLRSVTLVLGDSRRAARIAHESFVRTHRAWSRLRSRDPFVFTMRCAFRLVWRVRADDAGTIRLQDSAHESAGRVDLELALAALARAPRCVVVFSSYLGLDDAAIGQVMGLSPAEVVAHRGRAHARLASLLGEDAHVV